MYTLNPPQVIAQLVWGTGHLARAAGYAGRPGTQWVASLLGPSGLLPGSFPGDSLAMLLAGLAKLRTSPGSDWMQLAVEATADEMPRMRTQVSLGETFWRGPGRILGRC